VDAEHPYETVFNGRELRLRVNDFPDDHLYTLIVDGDESISFDDWPETWVRAANARKFRRPVVEDLAGHN